MRYDTVRIIIIAQASTMTMVGGGGGAFDLMCEAAGAPNEVLGR